jgi:hypothetical protein
LAIADFDRDGKPDLGVVHGSIVSIFFIQGAGNFSDPTDTFLDPSFASVQALAADVNNDGKIDMVILQSQPTQVLVLLGNGDGTFQPPQALSLVNTPFAMDGTKRAQALDDQLLTTLTLKKGTHQLTVVAVDKYIGIAKTTRIVKVR